MLIIYHYFFIFYFIKWQNLLQPSFFKKQPVKIISKIDFKIILFGLSYFISMLPNAAVAEDWQWQLLPVEAVGDLKDISCPALTHCIAVGQQGTILTKQTGDNQWHSQQLDTAADFYSVSCPTSTDCIAVGQQATLAISRDGGQTWGLKNLDTQADLLDVDCPTADFCVTISQNETILVSSDAGNSWSTVTETFSELFNISCPTSATCIVVADFFSMLTTEDGGDSWATSEAPVVEQLNAISCSTATSCIAVGESIALSMQKDSAGWLLQSRESLNAILHDVHCPTATTCLAVGEAGTLLSSQDGGSTWITQSTGVTDSLLSIYCPTENDCFVVGDNSTLLSSTHKLTVDLTSSGTVTVGALSGIDCGEDCTEAYPSGTTLQLVATPDAGFSFTGWRGDCSGSTNPFGLVMDTNKHCIADFSLQPQPGYTSDPVPGKILAAQSPVGESTTFSFNIAESGNTTLDVKILDITGIHASDFTVISPKFPIEIPDNADPVTVVIQCTPSDSGLRKATLVLSSNDPTQPTLTYRLFCTGQATASYTSVPNPGKTLDVGSTHLGQTIHQSLTVVEAGNASLQVSFTSLTGDQPEAFQVDGLPLLIPDGGQAQTIDISCTPLAAGLHTAILTLSTNDAEQPSLTYPLACTGVILPVYTSVPAVQNTIAIGEGIIGTTLTTTLQIIANSEQALTVDLAGIEGTAAEDFDIVTPTSFPLVIRDTRTITLSCRPSAVGLRAATLRLTSDDPEQPRPVYPLTCVGQSPKLAGYSSTPTAGSTIALGTALLGDTLTDKLTIAEVGEADLQVEQVSLKGSAAISVDTTVFPLNLPDGGRAKTVAIQCTPSTVGEQTATLTLKSNDPTQPTLTYTITCHGEASVPGYQSTPSPDRLLDIGSSELGKPTSVNLTILEIGTATLSILSSQIDGEPVFSITQGAAPFDLPDGAPAHTLTVQCMPDRIGQQKAQLRLTTNDPTQPVVNYPLVCEGLAIVPEAIFTGKIVTQAGVVGNELTVHAPEVFTLTGHIEPDTRYLGQTAEIGVIYRWQPAIAGDLFTLPITIATQPLTKTLDFLLFQGRLPTSPGIFQVELGYQLGEDWIADHIATLTVQSNRMPIDILLSANTVPENSANDTLIGTLRGLDADRQETFFYGLVDDAQGRFKVVNDELRVARGALLDFEQATTHTITVRVIDIAGAHRDKTFTLQVTDVNTQLADIHLTHQHIAENSPSGTTVGKLLTQDYETGTYQYELLEDGQGYFRLDNDLLKVADSPFPLDFEMQAVHTIKVRSLKAETQTVLEKTFDIEVDNVTDVHIENTLVYDSTGQVIAPDTVQAAEEISIQCHLLPDTEHLGQTVELISVAFWYQNDQVKTLMLAGQQWQTWNGDFSTLQYIDTLMLQDNQVLKLWQGQWDEWIDKGKLQIFMGYRLLTGEVVYDPMPLEIQIN